MREWVRRIVASAVLGLVVGGVAWIVGVSGLRSTMVAVAVVAAAAGHSAVQAQQRAGNGDVWRGRLSPTSHGVRRDIGHLGAQLRMSRRAVHGTALTRLRQLATHRLHHHGLDLTDPDAAAAAEALLGTTAYQVVAGERPQRVRYRAFVHTIDVLERLGAPDPAAVAAPPRPSLEPR